VNKLLGLLALIASGLALFFRGNAHKAKSEATKQRLDLSNAVVDAHHRIDQSRKEIKQKHRQERKDEDIGLDAGNRDHLNDTW